MSDSLLIACITGICTVLVAIIGALATIVVAVLNATALSVCGRILATLSCGALVLLGIFMVLVLRDLWAKRQKQQQAVQAS